ncbi:MAG: ((pro-3S)-lyase) ligase [Anaerosolibacter sp.]|jgi:[citrate (pro-3S)-lyase] ligase|uniref:[citrate (pro-3S)-lyase] ligase n=1 Tax=Anaerosolibacter sp. TaxID=1872527 RepID=UPI0026180B0C|nr:[citrate (pro-3S)-lyase] ligase [Anaerosolibacter sp.]MDF2548866.1 ((pro-3S)-lyase) ligase [Anaerosolibacter sp.]
MWYTSFREQVVNLQSGIERKQLQAFLERQSLSLDGDVEYAVALWDGEKLAATGSLSGSVLKCIAVDEEFKYLGLSAKIVTHLVQEAYLKGRTHLFIYTKPENKTIFTELGFYVIAEIPSKVVLMENTSKGIKNYINEMKSESAISADAAAVIVNCNPFTLGHRYLLEYAAARCRLLHVFVVWEEQSSFPAEIRYKLVQQGVQHLDNVMLHKGKDYIISKATFPSYFIKEYQELVKTHARLDLEIFTQHIAPALGIKKRFVGEEPYCKVTAAYNAAMQEVLPKHGIEVQVVPRMSLEGSPISASRVRELIRAGDIHKTKELVPETTYQFLISPEAEEIIKHIQSMNKRH